MLYIAEKNVNMGHRWRCKCGYTESRRVGGFRCSLRAPGKTRNHRGKEDPGWVVKGGGLMIRRRGRDYLRLEVSALAVLRSVPLLFLSLSLFPGLNFFILSLSRALRRSILFRLIFEHYPLPPRSLTLLRYHASPLLNQPIPEPHRGSETSPTGIMR